MKIIITAFLIFFSATIFAQGTTITKTNEIHWQWPIYKMNGKRISWKQVKVEMEKAPEAVPYIKKANTNLLVGYFSAAPLLTFTILANNHSKQQDNRNKINGYYAGVIASAAVMIYSFIRNKKFAGKAMRIYNKKGVIAY